MKYARKFGVLTLMLIFPICIIWFLRTFGENEFTIPVYHQNAADMSSDLCTFSEGQHYIPDFNLLNQKGRGINEGVLKGNISVVSFFFSSCQTVCPAMNNELLRVQGNFDTQPKVQLLSFSIDPTYDTPGVLKEYAERLGANEKQWSFLTGDKTAIHELVRCGFILPVQQYDTEDGTVDYSHSDKVILVDSKRRIRGYYSGTDREDVDRLITEMKILIEEEKF
jgi:protein SCO1/2